MPRFTNQWTFISEVYPSPRFAGPKSSYWPPERLCDADLVIYPLITAPLNGLQTSGLSSLLDVNYFGSPENRALARRRSYPLNQVDGSGWSCLSTLFLEGILTMLVLDLGFIHSS